METLETIEFLGNPLSEWLIALAYIVGSLIIARIIYRIFSNRVRKWTGETETEIDDIRSIEQHKSKFKNKKILDFGCGAGGFLKRAKNIANKEKIKKMQDCGITVANSPSDIGKTLLNKLSN